MGEVPLQACAIEHLTKFSSFCWKVNCFQGPESHFSGVRIDFWKALVDAGLWDDRARAGGGTGSRGGRGSPPPPFLNPVLPPLCRGPPRTLQ